MNRLKSLLLAVLLCISGQALGQGQIVSVFPTSGQPGQDLDIVIRGLGTHFNEQSQLSFGDGITVTMPMQVKNTETILAHIKIDNAANSGNRDVTVVTGNETATKPAAFTVFQSGGQFSAMLDIIPVQKVKISDFDKNNAANAPLLFTVRIFNDNMVRNVTAVITITGDKYGEIGHAYKYVKNLQPTQAMTFDNRQFDDYKVSSSGADAINLAFQQGSLPADVYTYKLEVFASNNNQLLASAEAKNVIMNPLTKPELISPGNAFDMPAPTIFEKQPLFQWFSQGNSYDFYLYRVEPGQTSAEEVAMNRPVYSQQNIKQTTLLYPASAYVLKENEVYAWRIVANYDGISSKETLPSEVFWFKLKASGDKSATTVSELKVSPEDVNVPANGSTQFTVKAFDVNSAEMKVTPSWKVIPSDGGTIDQNGNFKAGANPKAVAVVATYGDLQDYVMVQIVSAPAEDLLMDNFLKKLFGIPNK